MVGVHGYVSVEHGNCDGFFGLVIYLLYPLTEGGGGIVLKSEPESHDQGYIKIPSAQRVDLSVIISVATSSLLRERLVQIMYSNFAIMLWLLLVPSIIAVPTMDALFWLEKNETGSDTDDLGGCAQYLDEILPRWLGETSDMVDAGLQVFTDAGSSTDSPTRMVTRDFLQTYFYMKITETAKVNVVKGGFLATYTAFQITLLTSFKTASKQ